MSASSRREERDKARSVTQTAAAVWVTMLVQQLGELTDLLLGEGSERVAVLRSEIFLDDGEEHAELLRAELVSSAGKTVLSSSSGKREMWHELVQVWGSLQEAMAHLYASEMPSAFVVDVEQVNVAGYEPMYCRGCGGGPALVGNIQRVDEEEDPFLEILNDDSAEINRLCGRIEELLSRYGLDAPSTPSDGRCTRE